MGVDHAQLKQQARAVWSAGNYSEVARLIEPVARELVDACAISAGQEVLDVAAGNGNLAVLAAGEGAGVVASDITPAMVELGRRRTEGEGLTVEWVEADAEQLPFEDARFDCAASVFGAMFAPRPERVAAELFRVVKPGGTVGMANWTPDGYMGEMFDIGRRYNPAPEGVPVPTEWGREETVEERFGGLAASLELSRRTVSYGFESLSAMEAWFDENAPQSSTARRTMPAERFEAMRGETRALAERWNSAKDDSVRVEAEYLLVVARKRG